ncbi:hypothetical protein J2Z40_003533 [Cytobacillus eiseniae]|uniref:Holin-like toxin n=1 Tax=Cytobacillus eiseniae TaxID=762947 RepID=A0ABS4RKL3_9BACI|nr:hypothetical protein [Cytobacillus eiseniae]
MTTYEAMSIALYSNLVLIGVVTIFIMLSQNKKK